VIVDGGVDAQGVYLNLIYIYFTDKGTELTQW
jgi:hypothetical protein